MGVGLPITIIIIIICRVSPLVTMLSFPVKLKRKLSVTPPTVFEQCPRLKVCQKRCKEKHEVHKGARKVTLQRS